MIHNVCILTVAGDDLLAPRRDRLGDFDRERDGDFACR